MSRRWLTLLLLSILVILVVMVWPRDETSIQMQEADRWSLPPPIADDLFEDFSEMPSQGPPAELVPSPHHAAEVVKKKVKRRHGKIALIIDDIGYDLHVEQSLLSLPFPLAISVLPESPHAKRAAELAHASRRVVMLHLPMEPSNPKLRSHLDRAFLRLGMSAADLQQKMRVALLQVPFVEGVNNHMGSLLTANRNAMRAVMEGCRSRHLFFVDSRTGAKSVAAEEAKSAGLRWASRRVFLDHIDDNAAIARAWHHAVLIADHRGSCVVIGHPRKKTVAFLATLGRADRARMHPITDLLQ
ncbi:MAG: divergent polysaccharide deacetylase family protein [Mariprofundales bacterium]